MQLFAGFSLSITFSLLAWRLKALSAGGALAAALTGGMVFGLGGWPWAGLMLAFFISSSALSRLFRRRKAGLDEKFSKGSRRDAGQVLANGGLGALLAAGLLLWPGQDWLWLAYAGALAAANADTWATEVGVLSRTPPRLVTTGQVVPRGTSGALSMLGTLAALGGAALIGGLTAWFNPAGPALWMAAAVTLGGLAGSLCDSLLGATLQAIYFCPGCQKETERHPAHTCGRPTSLLRGQRWMDNDVVNGLCSLAGALVAVCLSWIWA